jgi:esterase/lipase superfamily enzyme
VTPSHGPNRNRNADSTINEGTATVDRRTFLRGATLMTTTFAGVGAFSEAAVAGGSDGSYEAPADYPLVTTRDHFDDDGDFTSGHTRYDYDGAGDWAKYTEASHDEVIVFVHGWNTDDADDGDIDAAYTCELALENNSKYETNVGFSWDSEKGGWYTGKEIATKNGPKLANWIASHNDRGGDPVRLIAHSLGARVVCEALETLSAWDRSNAVASVSLLGGAVDDQAVATEYEYGSDIEYATYSFSNYYKTDDDVLNWAYSTAEFDTAVGEEGIQDSTTSPYNYQELDVTGTVPDHGSYYEPDDGCMPAVVEGF